ncbi:PAS domain-containing protein [Pyxidicoccus fallax]|uniref:histidine kinase n=1 Tax=Pyxidicoccus fallax TaxID=394095 RepID=A0A848L6K3_9BACT|nr:ATP-binding protein [Pyxidicoccus fallax]NMO14284.1 PAS domain-containing protein [Pyxidicoccus fallax]NPC79911.1 PAS domain-containing protein [Pyxidicoccus fallax]
MPTSSRILMAPPGLEREPVGSPEVEGGNVMDSRATAPRVLLVDDNPANLLVLETVLAPLGVGLDKAASGREALRYLMREDYAVILLDVQMEGLSGLETAALIKQRERTRDVPIIFITAFQWSQQEVLAAYGSGAVDFLTKPFVPQVLCAKVSVFMDLYRARQEIQRQSARTQARERELLEHTHQQHLHRIFMQQSSAAISITRGPDFVFEFANTLYEKIIGRPVPVGASLAEVMPEVVSQPEVMARLRRVMETGEPFVGTEFRVSLDRHGTGQLEESFFNLTYQPTFDARGQVDGLITFSVEVTELVRARRCAEALAEDLHRQAEQLERWDRLFQHAGWGIASTDPETWRLNAVNPAFARLHGYDSPEEVVGRHVREVLAPETFDAFKAELSRTIEKGHHTYENLHLRKDGSRFPMLVDGVALKDEHGNVTYRAASFQDLTARKEAEDRFAFLARAGEVLAYSLDGDMVLQRLAELSVPQLADWCAVDVLTEQGGVERRVAVHANPERVALAFELARRHPVDLGSDVGIARVLRTGEPLCLPELTEESLPAFSRDGEHLAMGRRLGIKSVLCVPLQARGRVLGALTLMIEAGARRYGPRDVEMARELARRAGLSMDSALLFEEAKDAQARTARLQGITAALSRAASLEEMAEVIIHEGLQATQAQRGAILRLRDGAVRLVRHFGYPEGHAAVFERLTVDEGSRLREVVRGGQPLWSATLAECLAHVPELAPVTEAAGEGARAVLPLVTEQRVLGLIILGWTRERPFRLREKTFLEAISRQCAQAMERAELYRDAQAAIRLRDEFLSVASHELKTPLTSLRLQHSLVERAVGEGPPEKARTRLGAAVRQVDRLTSLVDSLLDVSRLSLGKLALELSEVDLGQVVRDGVERLEAVFTQAGCEVRLRVPVEVRGYWDGSRLEQVVVNLLSNAAKYGAGKPVDIEVDADEGQARLRVRDEGIGISSEAMPRLFGRFERGVSDRHYGGLGLGLYISRQIVEAMGGGIQVESQQGEGALFTVRLPLRR